MRSRVQGLKKEGEEVAIVEKKKKSNDRVFLFFFLNCYYDYFNAQTNECKWGRRGKMR